MSKPRGLGAEMFRDQIGVAAYPVAGALDVDDDCVVQGRSRCAVMITGSPKTSPHSAKPRFEVWIMAPFSWRGLTSWKNRFAPPVVIGR
jgi:hypothetical protein